MGRGGAWGTRTLILTLGWVFATIAASCGDTTEPASPAPVELRVGAFDFAESEVLAELYAQAAESVGVPVARLGRVGPREIVGPALQSGSIDLVPEYLGTALHFLSDENAGGEPEARLQAAAEAVGLAALEPSMAQDVNVFVVTTETADALDLAAISDLRDAGLTHFGGPPECVERPLCLAGLASTYGVRFEEFVPQPSLLFTASSLRSGQIDVGLLFSTSPELDTDDLVALDDDLSLQPKENIVPLIRVEALERWDPELRDALDSVSAALTTADLRTLNRELEDGTPIGQLAADWLASVGLVG